LEQVICPLPLQAEQDESHEAKSNKTPQNIRLTAIHVPQATFLLIAGNMIAAIVKTITNTPTQKKNAIQCNQTVNSIAIANIHQYVFFWALICLLF
jgi:hypothetical protein